jgi:hypothetical protein
VYRGRGDWRSGKEGVGKKRSWMGEGGCGEGDEGKDGGSRVWGRAGRSMKMGKAGM